MREMPLDRSGTSASSRRRIRGLPSLVVSAALSMFLTACHDQPKESKTAMRLADGMFVMDDFEWSMIRSCGGPPRASA